MEMTLQEFPEREPLAIGGEPEESGGLRDWGGALALLQEFFFFAQGSTAPGRMASNATGVGSI